MIMPNSIWIPVVVCCACRVMWFQLSEVQITGVKRLEALKSSCTTHDGARPACVLEGEPHTQAIVCGGKSQVLNVKMTLACPIFTKFLECVVH